MAAQDEKVTGDDSPPELQPQSTIAGLTRESDVSFYNVGAGIRPLSLNLLSHLSPDAPSPDNLRKVLEKGLEFKVAFYMISSCANICKADGILGDKERLFLEIIGKEGLLSDEDLTEALKGVDYCTEAVEAHIAAHCSLNPNITDIQKKGLEIGFKQNMILIALIASTQDGLVKEEYAEAKNMANKLGLPEQNVKDLIGLMKLEMEMARKLKGLLAPGI